MPSVANHPELLLGPNPLFEGVAPFIPYLELRQRLNHLPLENANWRSIPPAHRTPLLKLIDSHFVATRVDIQIGDAIQNLLRCHLTLRNPLSRAEQVRTNRVALSKSLTVLGSIEVLNGFGILISGITGTGKTHIVKRALSVFAPEQVISHESSEVCGWARLDQIVYLHILVPSNGSLGALLPLICRAVDGLIGTQYRDEYVKEQRRKPNLSNGIAFVCSMLSSHRVAAVVIDENQSENLDRSPWQDDLRLCFLYMLNAGIGLVLLGNPSAFENLYESSQLLRRFSDGGIFRLSRAKSFDEPGWAEYASGMQEFCLVDEVEIDPDVRAQCEYHKSAGLRGLCRSLQVESQRQCLRRGGAHAVMTIYDLDNALGGPSFVGASKIASSVYGVTGADRFNDLSESSGKSELPPIDQPAMSGSDGAGDRKSLADVDSPDYIRVKLATDRRNATRAKNQELNRQKLLATLPPEDARMEGVKEEHIKRARLLLAEQDTKTTGEPR